MVGLLPPKEVARRLGLSVDYTRRLMNDGTLPSVPIGRRRRMTEAQYQALVSGGWPDPNDPAALSDDVTHRGAPGTNEAHYGR